MRRATNTLWGQKPEILTYLLLARNPSIQHVKVATANYRTVVGGDIKVNSTPACILFTIMCVFNANISYARKFCVFSYVLFTISS